MTQQETEMNNDRRKALRKIAEDIASLLGELEDYKSELKSLRDEEQDYFDNMPESLQGGEKGCQAEAAVSALEEAITALEDLESAGISEQIETACE